MISPKTRELGRYFHDISKYKPLTRSEEEKIGREARHGSVGAKNRLITSNLRFVVDVAKNYSQCGVPFQDLVAEGNIGLMKAADKFDERKGIKFISYAVWWIRQSIQSCIKEKGNVSYVPLPQNDNGEVVCEDNESVEEVNKSDIMFSNIEEEYEKEQEDKNKEMVDKIMTCLDERERNIIIDYFGLGENKELTLDEMGKKYGLTNERVRQIKEKAMRKMKCEALLADGNEDFFNN